MKHLKTYQGFSAINEAMIVVGDIRIDPAEAEKYVDDKVREIATPEMKKKFKETTGLELDQPLREVAMFLKSQLSYINPVLYKKDLTQAEFDAMTTALIARVDGFIKAKATDLLKKMPLTVKAALSVIPESTLKKKIQAEDKLGDGGIVEQIISFLGGIPDEQTFYGPDGKEADRWAVICPNKSLIKTTPTEKPYAYDGDTQSRSDLFDNWANDNSFGGKKLVDHYIDLIVPILA